MRASAGMPYRESPPPPNLAPFVDCFWSLDDAAPLPRRILPDGHVELIVHLESPPAAVFSGCPARVQPPVHLTGQLSGPLDLVPRGALSTLGVRLRPGAAKPLLGGHSLHELLDTDADLLDLDGRLGKLVVACQELAALPANARLPALASALGPFFRNLPPSPLHAVLDYAAACAGGVRVDTLASLLGLSARQLERRFARDVGLPPKLFCRILRLQSVLADRRGRPHASWAELALAAGYADQAHLNRDARTLTGGPPRRLVAFFQDTNADNR